MFGIWCVWQEEQISFIFPIIAKSFFTIFVRSELVIIRLRTSTLCQAPKCSVFKHKSYNSYSFTERFIDLFEIHFKSDTRVPSCLYIILRSNSEMCIFKNFLRERQTWKEGENCYLQVHFLRAHNGQDWSQELQIQPRTPTQVAGLQLPAPSLQPLRGGKPQSGLHLGTPVDQCVMQASCVLGWVPCLC